MKRKETNLWQPRNPVTERKIRREVFWQITIPISVTLFIVTVFAVLAIFLPPMKSSVWADISLIWLIVPALLIVLIMTAITAATVYLIIRLIFILPPSFFKVQNYTRRANFEVDRISEKATKPFFKVAEWQASARAFKTGVRSAAQRVMKRSA